MYHVHSFVFLLKGTCMLQFFNLMVTVCVHLKQRYQRHIDAEILKMK